MPNVNNIFRKGKVKKQNLDKFDVLVEENVSLGDLVVSKYFNISRFPGVVPRGNSYFEIEGSKLLKPEVELKTELIDSTGKPVFHYAVPKNPAAKKLKVTMQITSDVAPGVGKFIILGELNPKTIGVPEEFRDTYNVRLVGLVNINTTIPNTESIEFFIPPRMTVSEEVKGIIELPPDASTMFVDVTGTANMTGDGIGFTAISDNVGDPDVGTGDNTSDDIHEDYDSTEGEDGDFEDFEPIDIAIETDIEDIIRQDEIEVFNPPPPPFEDIAPDIKDIIRRDVGLELETDIVDRFPIDRTPPDDIREDIVRQDEFPIDVVEDLPPLLSPDDLPPPQVETIMEDLPPVRTEVSQPISTAKKTELPTEPSGRVTNKPSGRNPRTKPRGRF